MKPSREVHGSGRVLYHTWRHEFVANATTLRECAGRRVNDPLQEGHIQEWAPSGNYLRINSTWYAADSIEIVEVLPELVLLPTPPVLKPNYLPHEWQ